MNNDNASSRRCGIIKVIAIREDESAMGHPGTIISFQRAVLDPQR
jgi:hypothetical protein